MSFDYDLFVIGAGPGGLAAAKRAAKYGAHVAIAEQGQVGGACVIHGCIPEKMMTYASRFSCAFKNADEYGWNQTSNRFNWSRFIATRDQNIEYLSQNHINHLQEAGVDLLYGRVRFLDPHTVALDTDEAAPEDSHQITAEKILIAVGAKDTKPDVPGAEYAITMREMLQLHQQPEHLAIIGSNHIATKFAGILAGLSPKVTQIIEDDQVLPGCDPDIRAIVQQGMAQLGIQFLCRTQVEAIEPVSQGLRLTLTNDVTPSVTVNTVVYATARVANVAPLELDRAGVAVNHNGIQVDEYSRTTQPHIFAIGDCTPRPHWTPVAIAYGHAFADTEFGHMPQTVNDERVPYVVSTQPEAAVIGLTETQARKELGDAVRCYRKTFQPLFNLIGETEQVALLKLVVDGSSDRVVGAHMVSDGAAEVIQMFAPAMKAGVTKQDFDHSIGVHPSSAEEFFTLA